MDALTGAPIRPVTKNMNKKNTIRDKSSLVNKNILLVEDNKINQLVAKDILEQVGIHVSIASNGEEAVKYVRNNELDAVLMDVQMPIMDGYSATKKIRESHSALELPIIAMTASALKGDRERSIEAGMNDYISKPINPEFLYETLEKWILGDNKSFNENTEILDFEKTLIRLGNKKDFYYDLLKIYLDDYSDLVEEFSYMKLNKQYVEAKRFIHSLKSVTANIGARKLSRFIVKFEGKYEAYNEISLNEKLEELSDLNEELLNTIKRIIPIRKIEGKIKDSDFNLYEALNNLLNVLEKANAKEIKDCMNYLVSNAQNIEVSEQINMAKELVGKYHFTAAKAKVESIIVTLKEENNG